MIAVTVAGVGFKAPGLGDWSAARGVLAGAQAYAGGPLDPSLPEGLPSTERRRTSLTVRLAIDVAQQAVREAGLETSALASVFASADCDGETLHQVCQALAAALPDISPTRFHNSVHNAASGYWSIAVRSRGPANAVTGADDVFGLGLLEAAAQASVEARSVLLVAYEMPMPAPLFALHPIAAGGAVALALNPHSSSPDTVRIGLEVVRGNGLAISTMPEPELEALRIANPSGRAIPLLAAIARRASGSVVLGLNGANALRVRIDTR